MRPDHDEYGLRIAEVVAQRATCLRRAVGAVLTNARHQVLATGYNGRAAGLPHCNGELGLTPPKPLHHKLFPYACDAYDAAPGTQLEGCEAIHAEQNALLQCRDVYEIENCYVTVSPCVTCVKLLLNTSCRRIVFRAPYAHDAASFKLWFAAKREWVLLKT